MLCVSTWLCVFVICVNSAAYEPVTDVYVGQREILHAGPWLPSYWAKVSCLPLSTRGLLERKLLRNLLFIFPVSREEPHAPTNLTICGFWEICRHRKYFTYWAIYKARFLNYKNYINTKQCSLCYVSIKATVTRSSKEAWLYSEYVSLQYTGEWLLLSTC